MCTSRVAVLAGQWQVTMGSDTLHPTSTVKPEETPWSLGSLWCSFQVLLYPASISYIQQPAGLAASASHVLAHCPCACSGWGSVNAVIQIALLTSELSAGLYGTARSDCDFNTQVVGLYCNEFIAATPTPAKQCVVPKLCMVSKLTISCLLVT